MNSTYNKRIGYMEGFVSTVSNLLLFVIKLIAGIVTGSVALTADAWHTLSDSISSVVVIIGIKLSSRKPDEEHPFGHGRWEQIAAIFIAFILGIIAYSFSIDSIERLKNSEKTNFGTIALVATVISVIWKEALAQYALWCYRKTGMVSLKADAWHHRSDALSSVIVLIGIILGRYYWWIDGVLGLLISAMLFYATVMIVKEAISKLLGEKPGNDLINEVKYITKHLYNSDFHSHHFHIHNYGDHRELTFHIRVPADYTVKKAHTIATEIEMKILEKMSMETTIHIEPFMLEPCEKEQNKTGKIYK